MGVGRLDPVLHDAGDQVDPLLIGQAGDDADQRLGRVEFQPQFLLQRRLARRLARGHIRLAS